MNDREELLLKRIKGLIIGPLKAFFTQMVCSHLLTHIPILLC